MNTNAIATKLVTVSALLFLSHFSEDSIADTLSEFSEHALHMSMCDGVAKKQNDKFPMPSLNNCLQLAHECHVRSPKKNGSLLSNSGAFSECLVNSLKSKPESLNERERQIREKLLAYQRANADIYFIPIGEMSDGFLLNLADHYSKALNVKVAVTPKISLAQEAYNEEREQFGAYGLLDDYEVKFKGYSQTKAPLFLGITHADIYLENREDWRFAFGTSAEYVKGDRKGSFDAIISSARMEFGTLEERNALTKTTPNLRKMVSRYIGEFHYKKERNDDPKSVLYRSILGLDDLDTIEEDSIYQDVLGVNRPAQ